MPRKRRPTGGKMLIEENGTGRQWTSTAACAATLGVDTKTIINAIRESLPIHGRFYFKTDPKESICWNCHNTAEGFCDLFTKAISYPPKGASFETYQLYKNQYKGQPETYPVYCVRKCPNYNPITTRHIVK